jgi:hypothetical protein
VGRLGSLLLVLAVAGIAVAAAVDAVRGGDEDQAQDAQETTTARESRRGSAAPWKREAARELRAGAAQGILTWTDDRCRVHSLVLPALDELRSRERRACSFRSSLGGWFAYGDAVAAPGGARLARCRNGHVELLTRAGRIVRSRLRGCSPAWTPDGRLTFVRDGELVAIAGSASAVVAGSARARVATLLSHDDVERALAGPPWRYERPAITEVAWLADDAVAAIVRDRAGGDESLALFRGRELAGALLFAYDRLAGLRVSPLGTYVAARANDRRLVLLDAEGRFRVSPIRTARSVTWSEDEAWTAMASPTALYVFRTDERVRRIIPLPLHASDIFWR